MFFNDLQCSIYGFFVISLINESHTRWSLGPYAFYEEGPLAFISGACQVPLRLRFHRQLRQRNKRSHAKCLHKENHSCKCPHEEKHSCVFEVVGALFQTHTKPQLTALAFGPSFVSGDTCSLPCCYRQQDQQYFTHGPCGLSLYGVGSTQVTHIKHFQCLLKK